MGCAVLCSDQLSFLLFLPFPVLNHLCGAQYIALLKKCKMAQRLKAARRSMQQLFPLTEEIWLEWLSDEQSAVRGTADCQEVQKLYEQAVQDYLSVGIWQNYLR